jgi:hypothetical protein
MIRVERKDQNEFLVVVTERGSATKHTVALDEDYYQKLTKGRISKEQLIEMSFSFLLARESKESILRKFNLQVIKRYFPEYESRISV